jgi:hypothetical protein
MSEPEAQLSPADREVDAEPVGGRAAATVRLGLIVTPALDETAAAQLARDLAAVLERRYPGVRWRVDHVRDELVEPPVKLTELVDAARARTLAADWDLAVCVTDVPLRLGRRPLVSHSSPTHGVALVSLPALGVVQRDRRLVDACAEAVSLLLSDAAVVRERPDGGAGRLRVARRLVELANEVDEELEGAAFVARVLTGNVRLLLGMIRANRPWRLAGRLTRALVGALATASYALVASDVWRIAGNLAVLRLAGLAVLAIATAVVVLIAVHDLWERTTDRRVREQVVLFNLVTLITVTFGIVSLYASVFVLSLAGAALLIDSHLLGEALGRGAQTSDYLRLAWLASSLATVGGALGGAVESDDAVREAAYANQPADEAAAGAERDPTR